MALGEVDYGLMGVVGGLSFFITFLNGLMANAVGRFYAFSIGRALSSQDEAAGIEDGKRWFSLAVTVHTVIPVLLMAAGYPIGLWVVRNYLVIPADRLVDCIWVFRFVCISCFLSMVTVPYNAMYTAKQYIAELTVYSVVASTLNVLFLYYMITHTGTWLVKYAFWSCALIVVPSMIIAIRGIAIFKECRFVWRYAWNKSRFIQLVQYCSWTVVGGLGMVFRNQGVAVLVNRFFGPATNASMTIANTVNCQTTTLTGAIQGAMTPVITTAVGAGRIEDAKRMSFRFCKLAMIFSLVFIIPLSLELPEVMRLWLKNPPQHVVGLCWIMLAVTFIDTHTHGHGIVIMAYGKVKWYQIILGGFNLLTLPLAYVFCKCGGSVYCVALAGLITWAMLAYGRLYFARRYLHMSIRHWARKIMLPVCVVMTLSVVVGAMPHLVFHSSLLRITLTGVLSNVVLLFLSWAFVLDGEERNFLITKIKSVTRR